ncbi:MAG: peptidoglycan-associated lipoprotein Pal [Endomicrobiaceae bacterium]|nr:peptidoglycan-associated lipoprotein Pal [Endomicrobiaceae bacterium]
MKNYLVVAFLFLCLVISACAKKQNVAPEDETYADQTQEISDLDSALLEPEEFSKEPSIRGVEFEQKISLGTVYFSFDSSKIPDNVLRILKENVKYLKANPSLNVVVEGHCDERGTIEYNLALGQKRAVKVKEYYVQLGIAPNRIATISYGEEMPQDNRHNEAGWAKNRRAETKVIK